MWKQRKGFTLIELMVVMAILAILTAIVVPAVTGVTTTGRETTLATDVNAVQSAADRFGGEHSTALLPLMASHPVDADADGKIDNASYGGGGASPASASGYDAIVTVKDTGKTLYVRTLDWDAFFTTETAHPFIPEYLSEEPIKSRYVLKDNSAGTTEYTSTGLDLYTSVKVPAGGAVGVWVIDQNREVRALINPADYVR